LRKTLLFSSLLIFLVVATSAFAQQGDVMFGFGTLMASKYNTNSQTFTPISEKGGLYPSISADVVAFRQRLGFNFEVAWRASQANYFGNSETFRPILYDFNALLQPRLSKKAGLDLMAGIGAADTRFYVPQITSCSYFSGCINYTSSTHFMEHVGGGIRYYVWGHVFVRPEIHYYHVNNNVEFNSGNLFRAGASIGYTIGPE
jgi:hypothetical protein